MNGAPVAGAPISDPSRSVLAARSPRMARLLDALTRATVLVALSAGGVAQAPAPLDARALEAAFAKRSARDQEAIAARLQLAVAELQDPYLDGLRACIADAARPATPRVPSPRVRHPKKKLPHGARAAGDEFPRSVYYHFGIGTIDPLDPTVTAARTRELALHRVQMEQAIGGAIPGADLAIAQLLRTLDTDHSADAFAAFLEAWRNGDESFYEALDRTAGTADSVFFYDVMLDDFVGEIAARGPEAAKLRKDRNVAHDALHEAFLVYRQYRALREAVAWSLVLPPAQPLPTHLARYELHSEGQYSLRDQVTMLLALEGYDVRNVVARVTADATPLPQPLWSAAYDPASAWNSVFAERIQLMVETAGDTDAFLQLARTTLAEKALAITLAAASALAPSSATGQH